MDQQETQRPTTSYDDINPQCCCFNMRKVTRAVTQLFDRHLEEAGIRATQFTLLVALYHNTARTLTEIADRLVMDRTTLTRNLKPLEKMELITTTHTMDKRSKAYILTEKGRALVDRGIPLWQKAQDTVLGALGDERYRNLLAELDYVLDVTGGNEPQKN